MTYTVVAVREEDGRYSVSVPALKGCHTWGKDLHHALLMAEDAIQGYVAVLEEDGDPVPADIPQVVLDLGDATEALVYKLTVREVAAVA